MTGALALYFLATLIIIIGGLSLILQKVYQVDDQGQETEIDVPFLGKLKTNYPAIGFVFIGTFLAAYTYNKDIDCQLKIKNIESEKLRIESEDQWTMSGKLIAPEGKIVEFDKGNLTYHTPKCTIEPPDTGGNFTFSCNIPHGKKLTDEIKQINFSTSGVNGDDKREAHARLYLTAEIENYKKNKESLIDSIKGKFIQYKDITVDIVEPAPKY